MHQVGRWKWDAWEKQGDKPRAVAMREYISDINAMLRAQDCAFGDDEHRLFVTQSAQ